MLSKKFLFFLFSILVFPVFLFAEESITITTYYPSPYGSYNQLTTNRLAMGDTNGDGVMDASDQSNRDGDIRLKAQAGDPTTWPAGAPGQIAYSSTKDSLYVYGTQWVAAGSGGGASFTYYCNNTAPNLCTNSGGAQGYCPTGSKQVYALGSWGWCDNCCGPNTARAYWRPPGGTCYSGGGYSPNDTGMAYVCTIGS